MRIGELATAAGVSASRIRFYETAGLLVPDGRTQAGYRIYGESALQALRIIEQAQLAGFTLAEIKAILPPRPGEWNRETLLAALRRKLTAIEDMQQQLARSERRLRAVIDDIDSTPANATCAETEDRIISKLSSPLTGPPASRSPVSEASTWPNDPQPTGLHNAHAPAQQPDPKTPKPTIVLAHTARADHRHHLPQARWRHRHQADHRSLPLQQHVPRQRVAAVGGAGDDCPAAAAQPGRGHRDLRHPGVEDDPVLVHGAEQASATTVTQ